MNSLAALLFPAILLAVPNQVSSDVDESAPALSPAVTEDSPVVPSQAVSSVWGDLANSFRPYEQQQVLIERRVFIRINPRSKQNSNVLRSLPQAEIDKRFKERKFGKCLEVRAIAGVQVRPDNRLLLFLRDSTILTVNLEKSCRARDFYSGFYAEPNEDGKICAGRDKLHSRAGANCELQKFRKLVPIDRD